MMNVYHPNDSFRRACSSRSKNPAREDYWAYTHSIVLLRQLMAERMFPLTLTGLDDMTRELLR